MNPHTYLEKESRHSTITAEECLDVCYSIQNRCEAASLLSKYVPKSFEIEGILHTLFEDNLVDALRINEGFCVVKEDEPEYTD